MNPASDSKHFVTGSPWRIVVPLVLLTVSLFGCAPERDAGQRATADKETRNESSVEDGYAPPSNPPPAAEPAKAPTLDKEPAGTVVEVGSKPEGIVVDPETGLVAAGLRNPDELALISGASGEVVRRVDLSESPRHLNISAPGGPVLVPAERSNTLLQVGLPAGEILEETPVGQFPHDAAGSPNGRIFVGNEFGDTVSVIEDDQEIQKLEAPQQPGGVATTDDGLAGVIGVRGLALEVYDANNLKSLGRIAAGEGPTHIVAGRDRFYVADTRGDAVLVFGTRPDFERLQRIQLPNSAPYGLALDQKRNQLWITLTAKNQAVRYDLDGDEPRGIGTYPTVRQPNSIAVNSETGRVYVTGFVNGEVQIFDP